jgi:glycerol kinase
MTRENRVRPTRRARADFVGALDQGTSSTRFVIVDRAGAVRAAAQREHAQLMPRPGWLEHDADEIWASCRSTMSQALDQAGLTGRDLAAIGITNQRETTLAWNRITGRPYHRAIVWPDVRTATAAARLIDQGHGERIRHRTGLPPASYFSALKMRWLLDHVDGLRADAERGIAALGTIDSWLIWNLTGGAHLTDVTNASRTMLMNLETLDWDDQLLGQFEIPRSALAEIRPSADADAYGVVTELDVPVPLAACLGDQQAAMVGHRCFAPGQAKTTYGTGAFVLMNTGRELVRSSHGLLSTVCYQFGSAQPVYALEGAVAVAGAAVQWLRDQLGLIASVADVEQLAATVDDAAGLYFVPAFAGLLAPHWRPDARGAIVGITRFHTAAHLARATLEAICYQTRDVLEAMSRDRGAPLPRLRVDGGAAANELCMQLQSDVLGIPLARPVGTEATALGAAFAAGLAVGHWRDEAELERLDTDTREWQPSWSEQRREEGYADWTRALGRSVGWAVDGVGAAVTTGGLA